MTDRETAKSIGNWNYCASSQVQIQGQQQGQMLSQVLQVPSSSHQQLQGVTTAQLIQPGELTEEQHQQVTAHKLTVFMAELKTYLLVSYYLRNESNFIVF